MHHWEVDVQAVLGGIAVGGSACMYAFSGVPGSDHSRWHCEVDGMNFLFFLSGNLNLDNSQSVDTVMAWSSLYHRRTPTSPLTRIDSPGISVKNVSGLFTDPYNSSPPTTRPRPSDGIPATSGSVMR